MVLKKTSPWTLALGFLVVGGSADAFGGSWGGFVSLRREENLGEVSL